MSCGCAERVILWSVGDACQVAVVRSSTTHDCTHSDVAAVLCAAVSRMRCACYTALCCSLLSGWLLAVRHCVSPLTTRACVQSQLPILAHARGLVQYSSRTFALQRLMQPA